MTFPIFAGLFHLGRFEIMSMTEIGVVKESCGDRP